MNDFISLGDIVTDAFIKLKEAKVTHDEKTDRDTLTLSFGDKIPYESVDVVRAVGNSPNASVCASRLGLNSALVSDIGDDRDGEECLESLKNDGVSTDFITIHKNKKTNYHYVLWYGSDRTILIKHENFEYHLPEINEPKWLYLSSLSENSFNYHKEILNWLKNHPSTALAFQPGTYQIKFGREKLKEVYKRAKITFCNVAEAEEILDLNTLGIEELLRRMRALGPEMVVITDGSKGAYSFDGKEMLFVPPYPDPIPPVDRTGAGDAFASTIAVALALNNALPTALTWGAVNSMSVVGQVGAQRGLLTREKLEKYLKESPPDFKIRKL